MQQIRMGYDWSLCCRAPKQRGAQISWLHHRFIRKRSGVAQDLGQPAQNGIIQPVALVFFEGRFQLQTKSDGPIRMSTPPTRAIRQVPPFTPQR